MLVFLDRAPSYNVGRGAAQNVLSERLRRWGAGGGVEDKDERETKSKLRFEQYI